MKLSSKHKTFIVTRLACFARHSEVQSDFEEQYGQKLALNQIAYYDPEGAQGSRELAQEWKDLFKATRKAFIEDTSGIAIAHKAYRLKRLGAIANKASDMRNHKMEMEALEQAAKEVGDAYTNRRELSGNLKHGILVARPDEVEDLDGLVQAYFGLGGEE